MIIKPTNNLLNHLIAAHPLRQDKEFARSVFFVAEHDPTQALAYRIDLKSMSIDLGMIMTNLGIHGYVGSEPVYQGGVEHTNRLVVIHSLDYTCKSTHSIGFNLGISYDPSILQDIAKGHGPSQYRVIAGCHRWLGGFLEGEISGRSPWSIEHTWSVVKPTIDLMFEHDEEAQWRKIIDCRVQEEIVNWFSPVLG